uniref:Uncharacterized protein n=1 Tax=Candidatus Methanogaster sp. ANME-2c ERB4 TaxID=2759911 RepID=A0A7G9YEK6_9EURY|nr:hypothetical protein KCGBEFIM_00015 [Methanosarcinales archaeon ANME-2c ERB4]
MWMSAYGGCEDYLTTIGGFSGDDTAKMPAPVPGLTAPCTQNIYISSSGWLYQTVQEVSNAIPGTDTTLQTAEGITIINKKEA